jgi:uncharacterized protein (UPF0248 family)
MLEIIEYKDKYKIELDDVEVGIITKPKPKFISNGVYIPVHRIKQIMEYIRTIPKRKKESEAVQPTPVPSTK